MSSQLQDYPVGIVVSGFRTVWERLIALWLALFVGYFLAECSLTGSFFGGDMDWKRLLFSLPFLAVYIMVVNLLSILGVVFSVSIVILVGRYLVQDEFRYESFFALCAVFSLNLLYHVRGSLDWGHLGRECIGLTVLAAVYVGVRFFAWRRLKLLEESCRLRVEERWGELHNV